MLSWRYTTYIGCHEDGSERIDIMSDRNDTSGSVLYRRLSDSSLVYSCISDQPMEYFENDMSGTVYDAWNSDRMLRESRNHAVVSADTLTGDLEYRA